MTPLPKRRHSTRRGGKRKAAIKYVLPARSICPSCGTPIIPHRACPSCGTYKGKTVIKQKKAQKKSAK